MPTRTAGTTGVWSDTGTWTGGVVPVLTDDVIIPAGITVTVDDTTRACISCTVRGRLKFSRTASSMLVCSGSVLVEDDGVLDQGLFGDRIPASFTASLRFSLNETTQMAGGSSMVVVPADVGLWISDNGSWHAHGAPKETWTKLAAAISAGATTATLDTKYMAGWAVGDRVVFSGTNVVATAAGISLDQSEVRDLTSCDTATGVIEWTTGLTNARVRDSISWTDKFGDAWTEVLTGEVGNLTSNVLVDTASGTNTNAYHIHMLDSAKVYLEDVRIANAGPTPKVSPMARYWLHIHRQGNGSAGSYLRRVRGEGAKGGGLFIHESFSGECTDLLLYNMSTNPGGTGDQGIQRLASVFLEDTSPNVWPLGEAHAADQWIFDRLCLISMGQQTVSGANQLAAGFWAGGGSNACAVFGSVISSFKSNGFGAWVWPEPDNSPLNTLDHVRLVRCEAHSNGIYGYFFHQNVARDNVDLRIPQVDLLGWGNPIGIREGAYVAGFEWFQIRAIRNYATQISHRVRERKVTNFLADGDNLATTIGVRIEGYVGDSTEDSYYRDGIVRNVTRSNVEHLYSPTDRGANSWVRFIRCDFDPDVPVNFGGTAGAGDSAIPPSNLDDAQGIGSHVSFREQVGLPNGVGTSFDLFKNDDTRGTAFTAFNARKTEPGTLSSVIVAQAPRCFLSVNVGDDGAEPAAAGDGSRLVTVTVSTRDSSGVGRADAHDIQVYANRNIIGTFIPNASGVVTTTYDMASHPTRRAYFWAIARYTSGANSGGYSGSRAVRVVRAIGAGTVGEPPPPPPPPPPPGDPDPPVLGTGVTDRSARRGLAAIALSRIVARFWRTVEPK